MGVSPPASEAGASDLISPRPRCGAAARSGWAAARLRSPAVLGLERSAGEVGDQLRRRGVEPDDVEHPGIGRVGDREPVRNHADHNQPCGGSARFLTGTTG